MASLLNDGLNFSGAVGVYVGTVLTGVLLYWAQHRRRNSVNCNWNVTRREWAFGKSSRSRGCANAGPINGRGWKRPSAQLAE